MYKKYPQLIKCAGFGGQGILALGEIIAIAAMRCGLNVSWLPSYGPESRGGTCNCDVILSQTAIAAPIVEHPNVAFVFNQPSADKFEPTVRANGILFYDIELVETPRPRDAITFVGVPFTRLGMSLDSDKIGNMIALGAYLGLVKLFPVDIAVAAMKEKFAGKPAFFPLNERAILAGLDWVHSRKIHARKPGPSNGKNPMV